MGSLQVIAGQLRAFPWAALAFQAETAIIVLMVWQCTKRYYAREWLRYAPDKARDVVLKARRQLAYSEWERRRLEAEVAELRGMVEGAKARLTLELVKPRMAQR